MKTFVLLVLAAVAVSGSTAAASSSSKAGSSTGIDCEHRRQCGPDDEPVCVSDGETYATECAFVDAYCENPAAELSILSRGVCPDAEIVGVPSTPETLLITTAPTPSPITPAKEDGGCATLFRNDGRDERDIAPYCALKCSDAISPVCGYDGAQRDSYISECWFLHAKCYKPVLEKLYDGLCLADIATQSSTAISTASFGTLDVDGYSTQLCNPYCDKTYVPVCGSNGVTYANECLLEFAMCQNERITKLSDGKCAAGLTAGSSAKGCVPGSCSSVEAPVCGSDTNTYLNMCLFANAQCLQPRLMVLHEGACGLDTVVTCATLTCPTFSECVAEPGMSPYCADVCSPERCGPSEDCELVDGACFTAPCSKVATCVPKKTN